MSSVRYIRQWQAHEKAAAAVDGSSSSASASSSSAESSTSTAGNSPWRLGPLALIMYALRKDEWYHDLTGLKVCPSQSRNRTHLNRWEAVERASAEIGDITAIDTRSAPPSPPEISEEHRVKEERTKVLKGIEEESQILKLLQESNKQVKVCFSSCCC